LVCIDEHRLLESIERLTRQRFARNTVEGYQPDPSQRPQPIETGRRGGGHQGSGQNRPSGDGQRNKPGGQRRPSHGGDGRQRQRAS
jgi:ATP-dependent RNA helicase RhlE